MTKLAAMILIAAALSVSSAVQSSEYADRTAITRVIVDTCVAAPNSLSESYCSCVAGVISGQATDREYQIIGRLVPALRSSDAMEAESRALEQSYTEQELVHSGELLTSALIMATCGDPTET